ncbi:MAG: L-histidine N(alpha)-methyltransferase [Gammaproteobacteria bacterium]|nr:L-histidine N(alpha)-methyltransferase [Gammaproteobacteria bacterium]
MEQRQSKTGNVSFHNEHPEAGDSRSELLAGLQRAQKAINPKYFYDQQGSQLFDQITRLPEYYPTRTEFEILQKYRAQISAHCETGCVFIEPGSGNCEKARLLLDSLQPSAFVPIDISAEYLHAAAQELGREYPWLTIHAVCADFNRSWSFVDALPEGKRVVFYPGSTIGNLEPQDAIDFLRRVRSVLGENGGALVGVDLHKSSERLSAAYNDTAGVTAAFNLNVLERINDLLDTEFDAAQFRHHAFYDREKQRIEMHLVSDRAQTVRCNGSTISFEAGESIHTENSYKYTLQGFAELAQSADLVLERSWLDDEKLFSVHYLSAG